MEKCKFDSTLEVEVMIAKKMAESGKSRDEVIAEAVSKFLCLMGFRNLSSEAHAKDEQGSALS